MQKLYLDDARNTPEGYIRFYNVKDIIRYIDQNADQISTVSLDHDLGLMANESNRESTGYDVVLWIEEQIIAHGRDFKFDIKVHSSNSSARLKMELAIKNLNERYRNGYF